MRQQTIPGTAKMDGIHASKAILVGVRKAIKT